MTKFTLIRKLRNIEARLGKTMVLMHLFFDSRVDKVDLDIIDEQYADVIMAIQNLKYQLSCDSRVDQ